MGSSHLEPTASNQSFWLWLGLIADGCSCSVCCGGSVVVVAVVMGRREGGGRVTNNGGGGGGVMS